MEMSKEEVRELIVDLLSEYAPRELLSASDRLSDVEDVCITALGESIWCKPADLGECRYYESKPLHLDEDDTPTILYEFLFPELRLQIEITAMYLMSSWHYYPRLVREKEWTLAQQAWFDLFFR
ncbi:hypothetical protein BSP21_129 [Bacillus phage BSP21]|nr:hypothetical protein BSP9_130 [Bacillus phage BSP9]AYJ75464.1 hypothetical protein BSP21_129 [Bacillus phage BSP21]